MGALLSPVLCEYEIEKQKIHMILRDGEAAMGAMTRLLEFEAQ